MNRRGFLRSLIGAAAVVSAVRTWPFRTFFIPATPRIIAPENIFFVDDYAYIVYLHPEQKKVWDELVKVELEAYGAEMVTMLERQDALLRGFRANADGRVITWNNLQRSPIRWTSRNDPLHFPA